MSKPIPKPSKKKKTETVSGLKKKVWADFSKYIRYKYADHAGYCTCVTCGVTKPINEMQAGHFIQGRRPATLFNEFNVHPQCVGCNMFKHGNLIPYYEFMLETYGQDKIDELKSLDRQIKEFTIDELKELHKEIKNKLANYI